ncbi:ankyrin repeat domain-containing protein [Wolbachia endosymbiont of Frankliniella intonsa]|uniref:ankyrin repeat domain-containing protein n=1 Tax=Wolbachia endosymbiont of Frankliniella intonsa TaxID=2902422 RepID=UPI00244EF7E9|nr:ankyrin repeat domain-containing protein [Wolbachia endosymbiont of Frankliniella intonsa]WGJ62114.1 ankyrin repeat domain-containing protein [Wolbachia endosymbiont of Frankliniella intonsa]
MLLHKVIRQWWNYFKKKADLYLQHHNGETALHLAADNGHSDVVAILIGAAKDKKKVC